MKRPLLKQRLVDHLVSQSIWLALEIIHIFTISPSYALLNIKIHLALFIGMSLANDIAAYRVRTWRMSDKRRTVCKRYLRANEACIFFIILPSFFAEILAPYMVNETLHLYMQIYVGTLFFVSFVLARALYDLFKAEHDPDHEDAREQAATTHEESVLLGQGKPQPGPAFTDADPVKPGLTTNEVSPTGVTTRRARILSALDERKGSTNTTAGKRKRR